MPPKGYGSFSIVLWHFSFAIDGSRDKFYNTEQVQFTGVENLPGASLDTVVDFEYVPLAGADGGVTNSPVVLRTDASYTYVVVPLV